MAHKIKSFRSNVSVLDAENVGPPQLMTSTPWKSIKKKSKRILKDKNSWNISVINYEQDQNQKQEGEVYNRQRTLTVPVIEANYNYNLAPELFVSDPEEDPTEIDSDISSTIINDSDGKWTTLTDVSEDCTNISDLLAEIDTDVELRFEKQPRRSYPGKKRNNTSMFIDEEEKENVEVKIAKKCRKPKQKKNIDPIEETFIMSINEHFNDVETFNLIVE